MNIVYLIGNGFDLSKNLPTEYKDFYDYYSSKSSEDSDIIKLKNSIDEDRENWSDLEQKLGEYTENLDTEEALITLHKDLINNLKTYLKGVENNYQCDESQSDKIYKDLIAPETHFLHDDKEEIKSFKKNLNSKHWRINIITFNYTTVLETLLGYTNQVKSLGKGDVASEIVLYNIEHIHGDTTRGMALGVNDPSQFFNEKFREVRILKNKYIKSEQNTIGRRGHDAVCQRWIREANLLCIFGLSFGVTDLRWWQYIGERLKRKEIRLIIFYHNKNIDLSLLDEAELYEEEQNIKELFLNNTSLSDNEKQQVRGIIFVCLNSDMFKIETDKFHYNREWFKK